MHVCMYMLIYIHKIRYMHIIYISLHIRFCTYIFLFPAIFLKTNNCYKAIFYWNFMWIVMTDNSPRLDIYSRGISSVTLSKPIVVGVIKNLKTGITRVMSSTTILTLRSFDPNNLKVFMTLLESDMGEMEDNTIFKDKWYFSYFTNEIVIKISYILRYFTNYFCWQPWVENGIIEMEKMKSSWKNTKCWCLQIF